MRWKFKQSQNKFGCTLFVQLRGRDTRELSQILDQIVLNTHKNP